jgi:hypothetical protein
MSHPSEAARSETPVALITLPTYGQGAVAWRRDPAPVGVEFDRIGPDDHVRLLEFLTV